MSDKWLLADKTRVLILGGGFGGLYAALQLEKLRDPRFEVTVVNRENFFLFTPMLHEIAASDLDLTNIVNPVRKMIRHRECRWQTEETIQIQNAWTARSDRSPYWCGADPWRE